MRKSDHQQVSGDNSRPFVSLMAMMNASFGLAKRMCLRKPKKEWG
ncbi:MAG: hypothetical protein ACP5H8_03205 [Candidatus Micrarchaeia archaeon]